MRTKFSLAAGLMLLCLIGCRSTASKLKDTEIPADLTSAKAKLGTGWNSDREMFSGNCLKGVEDEVGAQAGGIAFDSSMSKEELHTMLGFSMGAKAKYGAFKGSASAKFSADNSEDKYSSVTIYRARYEFKNRYLTETSLTNEGQRISDKQDVWNENCGDEYVQQVVKGASLLIAARIDFISQEAKSEFNGKFKVKGPAFSVAGELKKASEEFKEKATVSISVYQKGGDVGRLATAFGGEMGTGGEALIKCSMSDIDNCTKVLSNLIHYATSKEPGNFSDQIKGNGGPDGGADLVYLAWPYSRAGFFQPDPLIRELLYEQRRSVEEKLNRNIFLRNRKNIYSTLTNLANARAIYDRLDEYERENTLLIGDAIRNCFDRIKATGKDETKASCDRSLTSLTEGFQDIPDSELEIRQSDLPACDRGYVRKGLGCERITCANGKKYEETWTAPISNGSGSFVCNDAGADQLLNVTCDGNSEAAGLTCVPRACGTHPHNETWSESISNGTISSRCEFGVTRLVSVNCNNGFFAEGEICKANALPNPPPVPVKASCKESTGRVLASGDKTTKNSCRGGRWLEELFTCDDGKLILTNTLSGASCRIGGNPRIIDQ